MYKRAILRHMYRWFFFLERYSGGGVEPSVPPSGMLKVVPKLKALTRADDLTGAAGGAKKRSTASSGRSSSMDGELPVGCCPGLSALGLVQVPLCSLCGIAVDRVRVLKDGDEGGGVCVVCGPEYRRELR